MLSSPLPPIIPSMPVKSVLMISRQSIHRRQVAPQSAHIHAESEHVTIRQRNSDKICGNRFFQSECLVGKYRDQHFIARGTGQKFFAQCSQVRPSSRMSSISSTVRPASASGIPLRHFIAPPRVAGAVTSDIHIIQIEGKIQLRQQMTGKHHSTAHDDQHQDALSALPEAGVDPVCDTPHRRTDFIRRQQQFSASQQRVVAVSRRAHSVSECHDIVIHRLLDDVRAAYNFRFPESGHHPTDPASACRP